MRRRRRSIPTERVCLRYRSCGYKAKIINGTSEASRSPQLRRTGAPARQAILRHSRCTSSPGHWGTSGAPQRFRTEHCIARRLRSSETDAQTMRATIQRNTQDAFAAVDFGAIKLGSTDTAADPRWVLHQDVVTRDALPQSDL